MADIGTLAAFNDFMAATRQLPMSGPDKIVNQMSQYRNYTPRRMFAGLDARDYFKSGTELVEQIQLKYTGTAVDYLPTDDFAPTADDSLVQIKVPWRFRTVWETWTDHELELNGTSDVKSTLKDLARVKRQAMYTKFWDYTETALWQAPKIAMEGGNSTGKTWYSIPTFITVDGGLPNATTIASGGDGADTAFSTLMGISSTTYPNWKNQIATYDHTSPETTLIPAMDKMWRLCQFEAPEGSGDKTGVQDTSLSKMEICTNGEGYDLLVTLAREGNQMNTPPNDIGWVNGKVVYHGMPVRYVAALDSYFTVGYPGFFYINYRSLRMFFHRDRYLKAKTFNGTPNQPYANVEYRDTWGNLLCLNRREQGRITAT